MLQLIDNPRKSQVREFFGSQSTGRVPASVQTTDPDFDQFGPKCKNVHHGPILVVDDQGLFLPPTTTFSPLP